MDSNFVIAVAIIACVVVGSRVWAAVQARWQARQSGLQLEKNEALFRAMFPELQPWFHPAKIVEFVVAHLAHADTNGAWQWKNPAGFAAAAMADFSPDPRGERVRLIDAAGKTIAEFVCSNHPEGRVLRLGSGKFTVDMRDWAKPRVRYWHPQREFKWSRDGWIFKTPIAEEPFHSSSSSSDGISRFSSDSSGGTRAAAGFAGLGGTFDGGGASASWSEAPPASAPGASGSETAGVASGVAANDSSGDAGSTSY